VSDLDRHSLALPTLYPLALDSVEDRALLVRLDEASYRAAAFLDERVLATAGPGTWVAWSELVTGLPPSSRECDFIFQIGHAGSTLVSRLLDHSPRIFGLREPALLRDLARSESMNGESEHLSERAAVLLRYWARVWRSRQKALVKATSFVAELGPLLMGLQPGARAILMVVPPAVHFAGILGSVASRQELRLNAASRLARLERRLGVDGWRLDSMTDGEVAAMSWACEVSALTQLDHDYQSRVLWLDFEVFLQNPGRGLAVCLDHLHGEAPADVVAAMTMSPEMTRYSKGVEHAYDAGLRQTVLAEASRQYAREIGQGLAWLDAVARDHALVTDAIRLAEAAGSKVAL
jgi:hypothetical protein